MDETPLARYVKNLPESSILVCVGAKDGESIERLAALGAGLPILAFELDPRKCERLRRRSLHRPGIEIENAALAERGGELHFYGLPERYGGRLGQSLGSIPDHSRCGREGPAPRRPPVFTVTIARLVTLDDFCRERGIRGIALLKVDTCRFASGILKGAAALLGGRRIGAVALKVLPVHPRPGGASGSHGSMAASGYRLAAVDGITWSREAGLEYRNPLYFPREGGTDTVKEG